MRTWAGPYFDPAEFDPNEVSRSLGNTFRVS